MILIDRFLSDEQDPKAVEKVLGKLNDMLTTNEELIYLAVQKKPAVNLLPDCIAVSNKRIFYCEPANFGITMNFKDITWKTIKEVSFKEELFGSKFICVPQHGENIITEYIPKVQARKLYQAAYEQLENYKEQQQLAEQAERRTEQQSSLNSFPLATADIPFVDITPSETSEEINPFTGDAGTTIDKTSHIGFAPAAPAAPVEEPEDETTLKLRRLKTLYDKQLITLEEYEAKKANILDSF